MPTYPLPVETVQIDQPSLDGFTLDPKKTKEEFISEMGIRRQRRFVSVKIYVINLQFNFKSKAEFDEFLKWIKYEINYGNEYFNADFAEALGFETGEYVFRFVTLPFTATGYSMNNACTLIMGPKNDNVISDDYTEKGIGMFDCDYPFPCQGYDWTQPIPYGGYYPESEGGVVPLAPYKTEYSDKYESLACSGAWSAVRFVGVVPHTQADWAVASCVANKYITRGVYGGNNLTPPPTTQGTSTPSAPTTSIGACGVSPAVAYSSQTLSQIKDYGLGAGFVWFPSAPTVRGALQPSYISSQTFTAVMTGNTASQLPASGPDFLHGAAVPGYEKYQNDNSKQEPVTEAWDSVIYSIPLGGNTQCNVDSGQINFKFVYWCMFFTANVGSPKFDCRIEWFSDSGATISTGTSSATQFATKANGSFTQRILQGTVPYGSKYFKLFWKFTNTGAVAPQSIHGVVVNDSTEGRVTFSH